MSIKIDNNDPIWEEYADYWQEGNRKTIAWLRSRMRGFDYEIEETADIIMVKQMKKIETGMYPRSKWDQLLGKIRKGCLIDFYRAQDRRQKKEATIDWSNISQTHAEEIELDKEKISFQEKNPLLRNILLSPHRALQDAMIVSLAPYLIELKLKVSERFPLITKRVRQNGLHFEIRTIKKDGKREEEFSDELQDEICDFYEFLEKLANNLNLDDFIGLSALKILLLKGNPFFDLSLLSRTQKVKKYSTFGKGTNLIKKRTIKRPYLFFYRDYLIATKKNLRAIKNFIKYESFEKYPDNQVDERRTIEWYKLGEINSEIIKKQRFGRKNKSIGLTKKINNYNSILIKAALNL